MRTKSEITREGILEATLQLLSQREFADIGTGEIARSAGISEGTIFRYFPAKTDIYRAIIQEKGNAFFHEVVPNLARIADPLQRLQYLSEQHLKFVAKHRELIWVLHRDATFSQGPCGEPCFDGLRRLLGHFEQILRDGVDGGVFRLNIDTRAAALLVFGIFHSVLLEDRLYGTGHASAAELESRMAAYRDLALNGILQGGRR